MGAECETLEVRDGKLIVRRKAILPVETHYQILLPDGYFFRWESVACVVFEKGQEEIKLDLECIPS
jgi:hypothetical protein